MSADTHRLKTPVHVDGTILVVPVSRGAQDALDAVINKHIDELDAALAPFGLATYDIAAVTYCRVVSRDEITD